MKRYITLKEIKHFHYTYTDIFGEYVSVIYRNKHWQIATGRKLGTIIMYGKKKGVINYINQCHPIATYAYPKNNNGICV